MITVRLLGGARRSLGTDTLELDAGGMTIASLLAELGRRRPEGAPALDAANSLVAVNGADSSALGGRDAVVSDGDTVSIIPVVHGGAPRRLDFEHRGRRVMAVGLARAAADPGFLDGLRARHPQLAVQAVSSRFVLSARHLRGVAAISLESERRGILLSKRLETDLLMRFALTGQISEAIAVAGASPRTGSVLVCVGPAARLERLYSEVSGDAVPLFADPSPAFLKRRHGITARHLAAVRSDRPLDDVLIEMAAVLS